MENDENEIQNTDIQEQDEMENTEINSEDVFTTDNTTIEGNITEYEGSSNNSNDIDESVLYTSTTVILDDTQYNTLIENINMINQLGIIQIMFLFTIFIYLFIHFSIERRKF